MQTPACTKDHTGPAVHRLVVCCEIPPDSDPAAQTIDKIGVREALRALLILTLPRMRVDLVTVPGGGVESFSRFLATQIGNYAPLHLVVSSLDKLTEAVGTQDALLVVIGGGRATWDAMGKLTGIGEGACLIAPVASTGGAALDIYEVIKKQNKGQVSSVLLDDVVYDAMFRQMLGQGVCGFPPVPA